MDWLLDQSLGQFLWISNRGGGKNELRRGTIEFRHPFEPADHIGNMGAKHAPVGMSLIDDNETQVCKEVAPVGVMRQNAGVEHIRVRQYDTRVLADERPRRGRSIAVIDGRVEQ